MKFECDKCGECCRHLDMSDIYSDLDEGNGICKYLKGNICGIYNERPLKCRVEDCYYEYFVDEMTIEEYYQKNYEMCKHFKRIKG